MVSKGCQRYYSFLEPSKSVEKKKQLTSGTLSPDTITTTSSGYSTGGSSISQTIVPSVKEHNRHKVKSNSIHNLLTKLKSLIIPSKSKLLSLTPTKEMTTATILRQYSTSVDLPSSTIATSNTISLPFTYYHNSSIKIFEYNTDKIKESYATKTSNFEKISAWLNHTESTIREEQNFDDLHFIDEIQQSIASSPTEIEHKMMMKKTPVNSRAPRRSTSMVSTISRPIIEQKQYETTISPTSSFSSSILAKGMSENMTPHKTYHLSRTNLNEEQTNISLPKSNRRRAIDFTRRRTVANPTEQINNKENVPITTRRQQIYRFSPATSTTNQNTKKYYFHSNPPTKTEDVLMNSYGLTLLQQQKRQSVSASVIVPHTSENTSIHSPSKSIPRRPSIQPLHAEHPSDSLDDLLCDREVESYFYPDKRQSPISHSQHIYVNLEPSPTYYQAAPYFHGTLC